MHIKLEVFLSRFKIKSKQTKMYFYISIIVQISFIIFLISLLRTEGENVKFNKSKYNLMEKNSLGVNYIWIYFPILSNNAIYSIYSPAMPSFPYRKVVIMWSFLSIWLWAKVKHHLRVKVIKSIIFFLCQVDLGGHLFP